MESLPRIIQDNVLGCLCTVNENGSPSGATLFYAIKDGKLYFLTHKLSQKVKSIKHNPQVCFVVADQINYHQAQLYGTAKIVSNPDEYLPLIVKNIELHSHKTDSMVPYMDIEDEGGPVVIEMIPTKNIHFSSGAGLGEQQFNS